MLTIQEQVRLGCDAYGYRNTLHDGDEGSFNDAARHVIKLIKRAGKRHFKALQRDLLATDPTIGKKEIVSRKKPVSEAKLLALQAMFTKR